MKRCRILSSLICFSRLIPLAVLTAVSASAAPAIATSGSATYLETGAATVISPGFTASGGAPYVNGSLQFSVDSSASTEELSLSTSTAADVTNGALSVVGTTVYLGDGTIAAAIGQVDATSNGTAGRALKINFTTAAFDNSSFENGTSSGWVITNSRVIINGSNTIAGWVVPADSTPTPSNGSQTSPGDALSASMTYSNSISTSVAAGGVNGTKSLRLSLSGSVGAGGGVVRGPYAESASSFAVANGDTVSFWWSAAAAGDAYDVFGYLLNTDNGHTQILLNATGASGSATQAWTKVTVTVNETGNYKFIFISGSFDFSFGTALGANLLIDNVQTVAASSPVNDAVVQALARLVRYRDTSSNPSTTRNITIAVTNSAAESATTSQAIGVTPVNTAPVVSGATALNYTLAAAAAPVSGSLTITDADDTDLTAAEVSITSNFAAGDTLGLTTNATTMGAITASYNAAQGVLSISGTATLAQYRAALRAVTFASSSGSIATRTVTFSVTDAASTAAGVQTATTTTTVVLAASAPVITSSTTASAVYGTSFSYSITTSSLIAINSYSAATLPAGLSLNASTGTISGAPTQVGGFNVTLGATNASGASSPVTLHITVAPKLVTISGVSVVAKAYDSTPTATLNTSGASLVGLVPGDNVALDSSSATGTFDDGTVSGAKTVTASGFTLTGPAATNYTLVQPAGLSGEVTQRAQTISLPAIANRLTTDGSFEIGATSSSGLPVTLTVVSGPAMLQGSTITLTGASGTVVVRASQAGNASYGAAEAMQVQFQVSPVGPQVFFGRTSESTSTQSAFRALAADGDNIGVNIAKDNSSGTIIGYLNGTHQGFVLNFVPNGDGSFEGAADVYGGNTTTSALREGIRALSVTSSSGAMRASTFTIRGLIANGVIQASIVGTNTTFIATMQPQSGPTAAIAGYYIAPSTNTANGATYAIVGTDSHVYVLAVTPNQVASGDGNVTAGGTFTVGSEATALIDGSINPNTTSVTGSLRTAGHGTVTFGGIKSSTLRTDRLINLSSRSPVGIGDRILITGFTISGSTPKTVLVRAAGQSLAALGVSGVMGDPEIRLYKGSDLVAQNDNWGDQPNAAALATVASRVGAFPLGANSKESVLQLTLEPGAYTAQVSGHGQTGIALAEIYDASENPQADYQRLVNISSRGFVSSGENTLIGGFVVTGNSPKRLLIRGVGPTLAALGVKEALADPSLQIISNGVVVAGNNDWNSPLAMSEAQVAATTAEITDASIVTGAFALASGSKDSAVIVTLAPGLYSAAVRAAPSTSGIALVEIYEIP